MTILPKALILAEKPSVAGEIAKVLSANRKSDGYYEGEKFVVTWAIGHLLELLEPHDYDEKWKKWDLKQLPIIPETLKYKPIDKVKKQLDIISRLIKRDDIEKIIIATDPGREGELIARILLNYNNCKKETFRFWTSQALTPDVINSTMKDLKPASEYNRLFLSGEARQGSDWLVGMNLSRAATLKMGDLFSIGRVQTAVLSLIVDRRRERDNFKPKPYWLLKASFENEKGSWKGTWFKRDENGKETDEITRFNEQEHLKKQ